MGLFTTPTDVHVSLMEILAYIRGVDECECTLGARLVEDLRFESLDWLELDAKLGETWGWECHYPVDDLMRFVDRNGSAGVMGAVEVLREKFFIDVPKDFPGVEPPNPILFHNALSGLLTVGHLVDFVEKTLAQRSA